MRTAYKPIGKFQVLGTLGKGAHSTILHIRRNADSKQYALKVVLIRGKDERKFLEQAQHEFRVAQMLDHPNLVKIYALEVIRDWLLRPQALHMLIEYVNGKTLDTIPHLPTPKLVRIFLQVAAAMVHMHRRSVCHADLKPSNIILSRMGEVKIIDFGLAWIKGEHKGRVQGTPEYMAPEQVKGGTIDERTDIYNFGATMYRLLTFRHPPSNLPDAHDLPFDPKIRDRLLKPVQECNPGAPPQLCDLVHRCLSATASKRPERMSEIQGILDRLADDIGAEAELTTGEMEW
jgi:serine/threonine protein kinase